MKQLSIYELRKKAASHFKAAENSEGIDLFCSSLDWILPSHTAFIPDHPLYLLEHETGYITLASGYSPQIGRYLQPLEASWCLASPFVGHDPIALLDAFYEKIYSSNFVDWDFLYLSGIEMQSLWGKYLLQKFNKHRIGIGEDTIRFVADISGGVDRWMKNRSAKFRANMRRTLRRAEKENLVTEHTKGEESSIGELYDRILEIEARSWKGKEGTGIIDGAMRVFYEKMLPRLVRRGALRVIFIQKNGVDIAYVFGGVLGKTYRGLQMSYDNNFRSYSLGNLVQYKMIESLAKEGIEVYDLGSEVEYKTKWAERRRITTTFWIWRESV